MQSVVAAGRTVVVSPHLDDAALSCGNFLARHPGAVVLTVFTGIPSTEIGLTEYDRRCGFASSVHAMVRRVGEDVDALRVLNAHAIHLDEYDSQYALLPNVKALASNLSTQLDRDVWDTILVPLGLFHCDHERVADACMYAVFQQMRHAHPTPAHWIAYEDVPYRRREGVLQSRLAHLASNGWVLAPVALLASTDESERDDQHAALTKREAIAMYASQLHTLGLSHGGDQDSPERFWSMTRAK